MSVYVAVAPGDIERLSPLLAIFFQQVVNVTCRTLPEDDPTVKHHVLMLLDEFPTIGAMPHLAKAFAFVAGYWLRIALVLQDPPQLDGVYGRDMAKTILDNCGVEVVFGTKNQELTEALSKRVGDNTMTAVTEQRPRFWASFQWGKQSESEHPHRRPLMLPQEIARLSDDQQIVIRRGVGPIRARKIRWFEDAVFSVLRRSAPDVEPITVGLPMDDGTPPGNGGTRTRRLDDDRLEPTLTLIPGGR
jgi:type IV secretion system protein VirD4